MWHLPCTKLICLIYFIIIPIDEYHPMVFYVKTEGIQCGQIKAILADFINKTVRDKRHTKLLNTNWPSWYMQYFIQYYNKRVQNNKENEKDSFPCSIIHFNEICRTKAINRNEVIWTIYILCVCDQSRLHGE